MIALKKKWRDIQNFTIRSNSLQFPIAFISSTGTFILNFIACAICFYCRRITQEQSHSHLNVFFNNSVSSWWFIVCQSNLYWSGFGKTPKNAAASFRGREKFWKEHDCSKNGVTSSKTMMPSCKLVAVFESGISLKHSTHIFRKLSAWRCISSWRMFCKVIPHSW